MTTTSKSEIVERRGELLAELFLQDLNPLFVAQPTDDIAFDFFVAFENPEGGINTAAIEVKATERSPDQGYSLPVSVFDRLSHSNIPVLLLVVDVKQNSIHYAWLEPELLPEKTPFKQITVPVHEVTDEAKSAIRRRLSGSHQPA